jgi:hypothetical protein
VAGGSIKEEEEIYSWGIIIINETKSIIIIPLTPQRSVRYCAGPIQFLFPKVQKF